MPRYTDELDALTEHETALRDAIARRIALESGESPAIDPGEQYVAAAESAIAQWSDQGEEQQDLAAFRSIGPLQQLLIEHRNLLERIEDLLDRRLS